MYIKQPQTTYDVETTEEEDIIFDKCYDILKSIIDSMNKYHCDALEYGYPEDPMSITKEQLLEITSVLFNIKGIHSMY